MKQFSFTFASTLSNFYFVGTANSLIASLNARKIAWEQNDEVKLVFNCSWFYVINIHIVLHPGFYMQHGFALQLKIYHCLYNAHVPFVCMLDSISHYTQKGVSMKLIHFTAQSVLRHFFSRKVVIEKWV